MPNEKEFEAILNAVEHSAGTSYYAMCISGLVQSLAEVVRYNSFQKWNAKKSINIRTRTFDANSSIMDYINELVG